MPLFDTHAHYNDDAFDQDRAELLDALPAAGVGAVVILSLIHIYQNALLGRLDIRQTKHLLRQKI